MNKAVVLSLCTCISTQVFESLHSLLPTNYFREDVTNIMKDMPDGSFLVRDAARVPGYYTLILRKSGVNRLIRILQKDGLYGFAEPLEFESVMALVAYYRENPLAPYNPKLDITLSNPISKSMIGEDEFVRMVSL